MLKLVAISDTHNHHERLVIPECDFLIHTGDMSGLGYLNQIKIFFEWFDKQPAKHKVLICGNHDFLFQKSPEVIQELLKEFPGITYLQDSSVTLEGYKFYGSPWQPWYHNWAFNAPQGDQLFLIEKWEQIPDDTDILMTHGPPYGFLDQVAWPPGHRVGCRQLLHRMKEVKPLYHFFGHIHEQGGKAKIFFHDDGSATQLVNVSNSNHKHRVENQPMVFQLPRK